MSFILDALKKSESDRQRQNGPALFEVKVAPPRSHLPLWAIAIALLLIVNVGVVAWMVLRRPAHTEPAVAAAAPVPAPAPAPVLASPQPAPTPAPQGASATAATPALTPAGPAAAAASENTPPPAASAPAPNNAGESAEDLAPAAEPGAPLGSHVRRGTVDGVPLYQDWATTPGTHVPQLRLDLHVYAARPQDRFVMINMKRLREGDTLPEGVRVESITPEGAVLSYNGSRFLLPRD
ncbi:MAG TPA: general secretion pathway protein GspB [Steroidobacteraceae bacterium]|nr:general secretion pathway protein GspB [Steroidobacteraceae bacterium]